MIKKFIKDYLNAKLVQHHSLVIYDEQLFYRDLVKELNTENTKVFDASENVVLAREEAMDYWVNEMPKSFDKKMIFYVPFSKKISDDHKAVDPFYVFVSGGCVFPNEATDNYKQLCLMAMPDKAEKIEEIFSHSNHPDFTKIDSLKGGNSYPAIKTGLGASSPAEILLAFLVPNQEQLSFLEKDKSWVSEFKSFMADVIGAKPTMRKYDSLQKELWRIVLFSEFVYDLPVNLPAELSAVAKAKPDAKKIIYQVCKQLRNSKHQEDIYVKNANEVAEELSLAKLFKEEINLGEINTFSFEDSSFFNQFKAILKGGKLDEALALARESTKGIWSEYDKERGTAWQIGLKACELSILIRDQKDELKQATSTNQIIKWYSSKGFKADTLHREMEKAVQDQIDLNTDLKEVVGFARKNYTDFMGGIQQKFQGFINVEKSFETDIQRNINLFDNKVQPLLNTGKKTVYILADALRYELGDYLKKRLERADFDCEIEPSLAFSPTVTKYAMAALLPNANKALELKTFNDGLTPFLNGNRAENRAERVKYTHDLLGDKCAWYWEKDIIGDNFDKTDLLIVTTTEIDRAGENSPEQALQIIENAITKILKVCSKLSKAGYEEFILAADHGFVLLDEYVAGSNVSKPTGDWVLQKSRCLAGKGDSNDEHLELTPENLGVKSDVSKFLFLKNYAVYTKETKFFHEGISLQETITPCLSFRPVKKAAKEEVQVNISYKGKTTGYVTTLRPAIELACFSNSLFQDDKIDVQLEAKSGDNVIGLPADSENVNSTTRYVEVTPGQSIKINLALHEEFEGEFLVVASSPSTGVIYSQINLATDYL